MPLTSTTLGYVLLHIYDFDLGAGIYLPSVERYETDTPCIVASPANHIYTETEYESQHQDCLKRGFTNWLNVAVVSDTCDDVATHTEDGLVAAFNEDCRGGGWLWKMMNYRKE
jgi:hypothetical protein